MHLGIHKVNMANLPMNGLKFKWLVSEQTENAQGEVGYGKQKLFKEQDADRQFSVCQRCQYCFQEIFNS